MTANHSPSALAARIARIAAILFCFTVQVSHAASPRDEAKKCYYADTITKAAYEKAQATLQRNPNDLDSLICAGRYQNDTLKQYPQAVQTMKRAEQASLKNDERELNLVHRYLVKFVGNLPGNSRNTDDYNYYLTVRDRADKENIANSQRCWNAYRNQNFDAAIQAASPSAWRNTTLSDGNFCLGRAYEDKGDYSQALVHFHRLEAISDGIDNGLALAQGGLGGLYRYLGQYDLALEYGNKALSQWRRLGNKSNEATLLNNIANIYKIKGDQRRAITYYEQSLALTDKDEDKASVWNNLALIYSHEGDYPKAIDYLKKAIVADERASNRLGATTTQLNLGSVYTNAKDYPQAELNLLAGLKVVQQLGAKDWEIAANRLLAWLRKAQGNRDEYLEYLRKGLAIAQATGNQAKIKLIGDELKGAGE